MTSARLSALDASFLAVETPTAHMHVGWVAVFSPDADGRLPSFSALRDHIERRLARAPRYRQKLAPVPLGVHAPEWIDDRGFSVDRHVYRAPGPLEDLVDEVMSMPLRRDRPLWEMWICESARDQQFAIVGKTHHCMVDGIAAVELASLLLDITPEPSTREEDGQRAEPEPEPDAATLLLRGARDRAAEQLGLLRRPLRAVTSPSRALSELAGRIPRMARALEHSLQAAPASSLNKPLSPLRSLAWTQRPLEDLRKVKRTYGTTVNDVLLAAVAGGARTFFRRRGEHPVALKAMVPVSVRDDRDVLGNHVSFAFAELPCEEPDPVRRLELVNAMMTRCKHDQEPEGADLAFKAAEYAPEVIQNAISRVFASQRTFNLVVSNIPGPPEPMYMLGCPLQAAYPVVPLADRHALSVGMTSVDDRACFGIYTDREAVPDAGHFAADVNDAIGELLAGA
jgi:diacylglycerol O-acyltransferase / wax synthase